MLVALRAPMKAGAMQLQSEAQSRTQSQVQSRRARKSLCTMEKSYRNLIDLLPQMLAGFNPTENRLQSRCFLQCFRQS